MEDLERWVGRSVEAEDVVSAAALARLSAILDRDDPVPRAGDAVPPGWHWLFCLDAPRQSELGADGHARRGSFLPPIPLPRRMWAGGRMRFVRPLKVGERVRRRSEIAEVRPKEGRSGKLVFVLVRHRVEGPEGGCVEEELDLVYREAPRPGVAAPEPRPAPAVAAWQRSIVPDIVMLFRFSAVTFNSHRIHYDRDYATKEEGYPGLVVHGPLTAILLLDLVRRNAARRRLTSFSYRALRPLFENRPITLAGGPDEGGAGCTLWAADESGTLAMTAEARFA